MEKNKIKILHVVQSAGGVDRYLKMLFKYMDKDQFENIIVCSQDFYRKDYVKLVSSFEQLYMTRKIGINDMKVICRVRKLIKKYHPDIVYAHSSKAGVIARVANIGLKSDCIYNPHGWAFNMRCSKIKQYIYTLIEKVMSSFCGKIICISDAEKKSALDKKICKENKLQVIFNGVDVEEYEQRMYTKIKREDLGIPNNAFIVGMVGRISPQKAPDVFIKAAKIIKEAIPEAYFIIVGNGEQEIKIKEYAQKEGFMNSLYITGWVNNPMDYIELFNVACLLSRWEGFGLVLPEYMLAKKPIIATNVDAIPNIIQHEKNGLLVKMDDYWGVCEAVKKLFKDEFLRENLIEQGNWDVHNRFNARRVAEEHELIFQKIKEGHK